jgi:hypothetical protein
LVPYRAGIYATHSSYVRPVLYMYMHLKS